MIVAIKELMLNKVCLLCQRDKVYEINSHLTPVGITKYTFGERDNEEIYSIDLSKKKIETYFGRNHPQCKTQEIKIAPNVRKGIFCKQCEHDFGNYEEVAQPVLNKIFASIGKGGYKITKTSNNIKAIKVGLNRNVLNTFYLSVVWRQCIEQIIYDKDSPLTPQELERLRLIVLNNIRTKIRDSINKDSNPEIRLIIATTYFTTTSIVGTYANPHTTTSNPQLFFIGPSLLLYWKEENQSANIESVLNKAIDIIDTELNLENELIAILSTTQWDSITYPFAKTAKRQFTCE